MIYFQLFIEFFKVGLFSIGGGLATIPFLFDLTNKYSWFSKQELLDMIAISESTPGAIGVNIASYAGYKSAGIPGSLLSTLGLVLPAFLIILLISIFLDSFKENKKVEYVMSGLKPASISLILSAILSVASLTFIGKDNSSRIYLNLEWKLILMFFIIIILVQKFKDIHPIAFIILGGIIGFLFKL